MVKTINLEKKEIKQDIIINAAQALFYQKGYDKTSVNEIIKKINIAKGTFYYYFVSKEDLIDQMINKITKEALGPINKIIKQKNLNAKEKLKEFFDQWIIFKINNIDFFLSLVKVLYKDENLLLRHKFQQNILSRMIPALTKIIEQGKREKTFYIKNSKQTAEIIIYLSKNMADNLGPLIAKRKFDKRLVEDIICKSMAYERAMNKILGVKKNDINMFDYKQIKGFLNKKV